MTKYTDSSGQSRIRCERHIVNLGLSTPGHYVKTAREDIDDKCVDCKVREWVCKYKDKCMKEGEHILQLCDWHFDVAFNRLCPTHKSKLRSLAYFQVVERKMTENLKQLGY